MNSRWQANKIGLINFWYYDEQEFPFVKGRMLLRGENGSGKSVTMQSVIPLLLDGNMSPERLDPFGSKDRKMISYLLEEDDKREERTGYLYLEFKREESETYLTVGMGIRARRGKPLDKWYFGISDGRRIGKDFLLYKDMGEKITLSKRELEFRIQNGGQVFDRQSEYMEYVNRQVFGFDTAEEYKEMIDLLIQLRTPKLSKDFKPSVVNDILRNSLQPLSDEDLRPMSEAIENMDTLNINLKTRLEGKQAAEKINRVYERYNKLMLYEKAKNFVGNAKELEELEKEQRRKGEELEDSRKKVQELEIRKQELEAKKEAMEKERESLGKSDAVALKEREVALSGMITDKEHTLRDKEGQLDSKKSQWIDIDGKRQETENRRGEKEESLHQLLEDMEEEAETMGFEEHTFFESEFLQGFQNAYSFETHQHQMEKTKQGIEKGLQLLEEIQRIQKVLDELLQRHNQKQREWDDTQRQIVDLEKLMVQVQNEWKEAVFAWNGNNQELVLLKDVLKKLAEYAEQYGEESDFAQVRELVANQRFLVDAELKQEFQQAKRELDLKQVQQKELAQELKEWEEQKEPEPERSEAVLRNRKRLTEKKIPYVPFYKMLEFGSQLKKEDCDRLEEALLQMGILDALVIDEAYKEQVLKFDKGCCDRYLFAGKNRVENSIMNVLDLNDAVNDIFVNQRMNGILSNIAYEGAGVTAVHVDGTYQIGVLSGTITGEHEAGFLGTKAREQNRQAKIAACKQGLEALDAEIHELEQRIEDLQHRMDKLEQEYNSFPKDEDLRTNYRMLADAEHKGQRQREDILLLEKEIQQEKAGAEEIKKEALRIAEGLYLPCRYDVFREAEQASRQYEKYFTQLKFGHEAYLQLVASLENLVWNLESLDGDMEQIRYDMGKTERELKKYQEEKHSIEEQLKLTDYEEIKERLEACVTWLQGYGDELSRCVEDRTKELDRGSGLEEKLARGRTLIQTCTERKVYFEKCYVAELALGYVKLPEWKGSEGGAGQWDSKVVMDYLASECENMKKDNVVALLNQTYFEHRGVLNDYQLTQQNLFQELNDGIEGMELSVSRMDIQARYQGVKIPFGKLLQHLEEDIEELQNLLKDGDRELFEDILSNTISRKIRGKINASNAWVEKMNTLMGAMNTSSGLRLSLRWRAKNAEVENQLDTKELVELLKKDYRLMREEEVTKLSAHFRSKVEEARRSVKDGGEAISFYQVMKDTLDYRKWFEFQLFSQKEGERQKELTNSVFGTFSGGEKAMSMYVPLFSAVVAKYQGGRSDAPRLIALDEAFAGVDNRNICDMFRLMRECEFDFIVNSQVLWGDYDTLDALAIYQLIRPKNVKFVTVMSYLWNGKTKETIENEEQMEQYAAKLD